MLKLKALKTIGSGKEQVIVEYDRVYLTHGSRDELESYDKSTDGKVIQRSQVVSFPDGKPIGGEAGDWKGQRPKNVHSVHDVAELQQEALNYAQTTYPTEKVGDKDVPVDPWVTCLQAEDYGFDLWVKAQIQSKMAPVKPLDINTAVAKLAKILQATGMSADKALETAKLMAAA